MPEMYSVILFNTHQKRVENVSGPFTYARALKRIRNESVNKYYAFIEEDAELIFKGNKVVLSVGQKEWVWQIVEAETQTPCESDNSSGIRVDIPNGYFVASKASDPDYPGIDIDFIDAKEITGQANERLSRPRVLFEYPKDDELRVLVWTDPNNEDYTQEITFPLYK